MYNEKKGEYTIDITDFRVNQTYLEVYTWTRLVLNKPLRFYLSIYILLKIQLLFSNSKKSSKIKVENHLNFVILRGYCLEDW